MIRSKAFAGVAIAAGLTLGAMATGASAATFSNGTPIGLGSTFNNPNNPYPSPIQVSGLKGPVSNVKVTLAGFNENDLFADFMVVGPEGQSVVVMADKCSGQALNGETFTFDDEAAKLLDDSCAGDSGTVRTTGPEPGDLPFPGIAAGFAQGSKLDAFRSSNGNGTWRLFSRVSTQGGLGGTLGGGWSLELDVAPDCAGKTSTIAGTPGNDVLVGTAKQDVVVGLAGKDVIRGLGANDVICGGGGPDRLLGGAGKDRLIGQGGKDSCAGNAGKDTAARTCEKSKSA